MGFLVEGAPHRPEFCLPVARPLPGGKVPSRLMAVADDHWFDHSWYPTIAGESVRWMGLEAGCRLAVPPGDAPLYLQLHVGFPFAQETPPTLTVRQDGLTRGKLLVDRPWITLHFPVEADRPVLSVTLSLDRFVPAEAAGDIRDLGLRMDEIALVRHGDAWTR